MSDDKTSPSSSFPASEKLLLPSAADEYEWAGRILQLLDNHAHLSHGINHNMKVRPGSSLMGDDNISPALPLSYYLRYLLTAAADNFSAIRSMSIASENDSHINLALHPFAPYTLVRNVIECASTCYWVLMPTSRPKRIHRHAMLELDDAKKSLSAVTQYGGSGEKTYTRRVQLIQSMIAHYPDHIAWKNVTQGFSVTGALREVGTASAFASVNPLGHWQLASGMAHGKRWAGLALSDKEPFYDGPNDDTYMVTGSYKHLWWLMNTASMTLSEAHRLFVERATAHYH
ncbi:hypothetical protein [Arthrobacter sp. BE255]|uniref:hypothetical protein n=1 Tax=Arthrobacter sp. BE255 TaxID=2817721 RepID=UPI00286614F4|nr:hypothetical protein [Arthrobacter sp. BE255]MDR7161797.1 hypothetical protein [Arthrobacter sp. BE255]